MGCQSGTPWSNRSHQAWQELLCSASARVLESGFTWNLFWNAAFHEKAGRTCFLIDGNLRYKAPFFRPIIDMWTNDDRYCLAADKSSIKQAMAQGDSVASFPAALRTRP